jgi:hypothetical protein
MTSAPHARLLHDAGYILREPAVRGFTVWRGRGLRVIDRITDEYRRLLSDLAPELVVDPDAVVQAAPYRTIFGDYENVFRLGGSVSSRMLRADNVVDAVPSLLDGARGAGQHSRLTISGLYRRSRGPVSPLFRETYIWPCLEVNHLTRRSDTGDALREHLERLRQLFAWMGLATFVIEVDELGHYGRSSYLVATVLPDGSPTVLATVYALGELLLQRLDVPESYDVVDVGLTAKPLAVATLVHADGRGLMLPSGLTETQLGILVRRPTSPAGGGAPAGTVEAWLDRLAASSIRVELQEIAVGTRAAAAGERRLHRRGAPLVVGLRPLTHGAEARVSARAPLRRWTESALPEPSRIAETLASHDQRLTQRSSSLVASYLDSSVAHLCDRCAPAVAHFGRPVCAGRGPCVRCGTRAQPRLLTRAGRFY